MDHQNQNINPDYSFILDKPAPAERKPRFSKKLVIGLVAVVVVLGGVILLSALAPKNYSTQATQTSLAYFGYINQSNYDAAYGLLQTNSTSTKTAFSQRIGPVMQGSYNLSKCVSKGTTKQRQVYQTTVSCPFAATGIPQTFILQTQRQGGSMVITKFTIPELKAKT